jgi:hypothetical protein
MFVRSRGLLLTDEDYCGSHQQHDTQDPADDPPLEGLPFVVLGTHMAEPRRNPAPKENCKINDKKRKNSDPNGFILLLRRAWVVDVPD